MTGDGGGRCDPAATGSPEAEDPEAENQEADNPEAEDPAAESRRAFIGAHTRLQAPPHTPELRLHLADEALELWHRTEAELEASGLPPPFWAFAWAGGQGLARHLLDHRELVRGRRVLDFATGSGIVAIAAAMAGAAGVEAVDTDPFAVEAAALNAAANGVALTLARTDPIGLDRGWDAVLAGDIFYDRALAAAALPWLERLSGRGALVLVGDPGRAYCPADRLTRLATYEVAVTRALEDAEVKRTTVWRL